MQKTLQVITLVFRSRRGLNLRPVNRIKHVIDRQGGIAAGAGTTIALITASDTPDLANDDEVETGSTVHGIYLKVEINATTSAALSNCYMYVAKNPAGAIALPQANVVGISSVKKYIIHQEMVMLQQVDNSNPRTLFNGVIAIPRGYKRQGPLDVLSLRLFTPGVAINFCIQCHYKEFR